MWTKRVSSKGEVVRAGLTWGSVILDGLTFEEVFNYPKWSVRLRSEIPMLVIPPPPGVDWTATQEERMGTILTSWKAAGLVADPRMTRAKGLPVSRWDSTDDALKLLDNANIDCWTWSLYAAQNTWGKYPPTIMRWFTCKAVSEREEHKLVRPHQSGWTTPTEKSTELFSIRERVHNKLLELSNSGVEFNKWDDALNEICTEERFQCMLEDLSNYNFKRLVDVNKSIKKGGWPWPTLRALGPQE